MLFGRAGVPGGVEKGSGGMCRILCPALVEEVLMTRRLVVGSMTNAGEVPGQGRITFSFILFRC